MLAARLHRERCGEPVEPSAERLYTSTALSQARTQLGFFSAFICVISVLFNGTLTTLTGADNLMILFFSAFVSGDLRHQRPVQWHADYADGR